MTLPLFGKVKSDFLEEVIADSKTGDIIATNPKKIWLGEMRYGPPLAVLGVRKKDGR